MDVSGCLHASVALPVGKSTTLLIEYGVRWILKPIDHFVCVKNVLSLSGFELRIVQLIA